MNAEKVKALKDRAAKATTIAGQIENVTKAGKFDDLDWLLRDEALRLAKAGLLVRLEAELLELLGESKSVIDDHAIGTLDTSDMLDSSDTWEAAK